MPTLTRRPRRGGGGPGCAGDDIRGNFVLIRHAPAHGLIDPRPQPEDPLVAFPPFIARGLVVSSGK